MYFLFFPFLLGAVNGGYVCFHLSLTLPPVLQCPFCRLINNPFWSFTEVGSQLMGSSKFVPAPESIMSPEFQAAVASQPAQSHGTGPPG